MYAISVTHDNVSFDKVVSIKTNLIVNETEKTLFIFSQKSSRKL